MIWGYVWKLGHQGSNLILHLEFYIWGVARGFGLSKDFARDFARDFTSRFALEIHVPNTQSESVSHIPLELIYNCPQDFRRNQNRYGFRRIAL